PPLGLLLHELLDDHLVEGLPSRVVLLVAEALQLAGGTAVHLIERDRALSDLGHDLPPILGRRRSRGGARTGAAGGAQQSEEARAGEQASCHRTSVAVRPRPVNPRAPSAACRAASRRCTAWSGRPL